MQSSLYVSLQQAEKMAHERAAAQPADHHPAHAAPPRDPQGEAWFKHVPTGGAILSPGVEVFRGGTNDGYPFWEAAVPLAGVASIAVFNKNERVRDSPLDAPPDTAEYMQDLRNMWRSVFLSAEACGATTVVAPDAGCGVFRNDPEQVGTAFGEVLSEHTYGVSEVLVSGRRDFFTAVQAAAPAGACSQEPPDTESPFQRREAATKIQAIARGKADRGKYPSSKAREACGEAPPSPPPVKSPASPPRPPEEPARSVEDVEGDGLRAAAAQASAEVAPTAPVVAAAAPQAPQELVGDEPQGLPELPGQVAREAGQEEEAIAQAPVT